MLHPKADFTEHQYLEPFIAAGYMALGCDSRWPNNDEECIHESLLLDFAAGVHLLREQGAEQIILVGSSGGSSLAAFYQAQATAAEGNRLIDTPAGDALDLNQYSLPAGDALILIGEHPGEGALMLKWLDPSVTDESDPLSCDRSLDMYNPANGFQLPPTPSKYSDEFVSRYRAAQLERSRRIDATAHQRIRERREAAAGAQLPDQLDEETQKLARRAAWRGQMEIFRVQADLRMVDLSIEPDERDIAPPRPDLVNYGSSFARYMTPEAWLSTWSGTSSRANTIDNVGHIHEPTLIVHYCGDQFLSVAESDTMFDRSPAVDKTRVLLEGHDHHGYLILGQGKRSPEHSDAGKKAMLDWVQKRFPITM